MSGQKRLTADSVLILIRVGEHSQLASEGPATGLGVEPRLVLSWEEGSLLEG